MDILSVQGNAYGARYVAYAEGGGYGVAVDDDVFVAAFVINLNATGLGIVTGSERLQGQSVVIGVEGPVVVQRGVVVVPPVHAVIGEVLVEILRRGELLVGGRQPVVVSGLGLVDEVGGLCVVEVRRGVLQVGGRAGGVVERGDGRAILRDVRRVEVARLFGVPEVDGLRQADSVVDDGRLVGVQRAVYVVGGVAACSTKPFGAQSATITVEVGRSRAGIVDRSDETDELCLVDVGSNVSATGKVCGGGAARSRIDQRKLSRFRLFIRHSDEVVVVSRRRGHIFAVSIALEVELAVVGIYEGVEVGVGHGRRCQFGVSAVEVDALNIRAHDLQGNMVSRFEVVGSRQSAVEGGDALGEARTYVEYGVAACSIKPFGGGATALTVEEGVCTVVLRDKAYHLCQIDVAH